MRGGVAYRVGLIVLVLLLTGVAIFVVRPREFLLTYCAVGPFVASLLGMAWFRRPAPRNSFLVLASVSLVSGLLDPITYFTDRPVVQADGTWNNQYHYLWDANLGIALPQMSSRERTSSPTTHSSMTSHIRPTPTAIARPWAARTPRQTT